MPTTQTREALRPPRVYAIADAETLGEDSMVAAVEAFLAAGIHWVQLRGKHLSGRALADWAHAVRDLAGSSAGDGRILWLNDRADIAAAVPVGGLHLGQDDLPPARARGVVGAQCWIGQSTHNEQQVAAAADDPAVDVVAVGPVYATSSKADAEPVVGLELVRYARKRTTKPVVAIGGINVENAPAVLAAGADTVALLGALCRGDVAARARRVQTLVGELR